MNALTGTLAVLSFGLVAATLYALKIVTRNAKETVEAVRQMAETNTGTVASAVKDAVGGIVEALALNSQGPPPVEGPHHPENEEWARTQVGGPDGVPWADWTMDEIPNEGHDLIASADEMDVPGIPKPDLSGERYGA